MKPVFVTGASGFVGWHVAKALLEKGHRVKALVRGAGRVRDLGVELAFGDLRDLDSLQQAVAGCGVVYHVAADYRLWVKDPGPMYETNIAGTRNMLAAAAKAGAERFVYTSTVGCIGFVKGGVGNEETPTTLEDMAGHYKRSKFLAEKAVLEFAATGLPVVVVNPTAPVGDHDFKPTPTGKTIVDFLKGAMPAYLDTGLNLVDVEDVARGHLLACERGQVGERYILGCENLTLQQIFERLGRISGRKAPTFRIPYRLALVAGMISTAMANRSGKEPRIPLEAVRMASKQMWVTHHRAEEVLGFRPGPVDTALERAVRWFRENGYCRGS